MGQFTRMTVRYSTTSTVVHSYRNKLTFASLVTFEQKGSPGEKQQGQEASRRKPKGACVGRVFVDCIFRGGEGGGEKKFGIV